VTFELDKRTYRGILLGFSRKLLWFSVFLVFAWLTPLAHAQAKKPNILVIFGDDIGIPQISAYSMGIASNFPRAPFTSLTMLSGREVLSRKFKFTATRDD
jgi:hypothetical protein